MSHVVTANHPITLDGRSVAPGETVRVKTSDTYIQSLIDAGLITEKPVKKTRKPSTPKTLSDKEKTE